jgi:hypothetical protein
MLIKNAKRKNPKNNVFYRKLIRKFSKIKLCFNDIFLTITGENSKNKIKEIIGKNNNKIKGENIV